MDLKGKAAVICGGGGFIGGHLVKSLLADGVNVIRAVDVKPMGDWYQVSSEVENVVADLKDKDSCYRAVNGADVVFQLAADIIMTALAPSWEEIGKLAAIAAIRLTRLPRLFARSTL